MKNSNAVQFSARGTSDIDITIRRASQLPGVGQYQISSSPTSLRQSGKLSLNLFDLSASSDTNGSQGSSTDSADNMSVNTGAGASSRSAPLLSPLISPTMRLQKQSTKMFTGADRQELTSLGSYGLVFDYSQAMLFAVCSFLFVIVFVCYLLCRLSIIFYSFILFPLY